MPIVTYLSIIQNADEYAISQMFQIEYISADWLLRNFQHHLFISSFVASLSIQYCFIIDMLIETPLGKKRNSVLIMYPVTFFDTFPYWTK